jgi:hypothetical protein
MNPITIRQSTDSDVRELRRLAELDSTRPLSGPALIAEHGGHAVAAVSLDGRRSIADPFLPTADVVEMLLKLAS